MHDIKLNKLIVMALLSFIAMYVLMYAMVDGYADVYANLNQFYMAALMTGAMVLLEMAVMSSMYGRKVKVIAFGLGIISLVAFFVLVRSQFGITDKEFLKSMISHHGSALLMCERSKTEDPEIKSLCSSIISGQQEQIDWMKAKLSALK